MQRVAWLIDDVVDAELGIAVEDSAILCLTLIHTNIDLVVVLVPCDVDLHGARRASCAIKLASLHSVLKCTCLSSRKTRD